MKIDEKTIEKMFEEWFLNYPSWQVTMSRQESCQKAWQAAINLLLPIIQKQDEAIRFYSDTNNYRHSHTFLTGEFWSSIKYQDCYFDEAEGLWFGGKKALATKQEVSEMIKRLGGEG